MAAYRVFFVDADDHISRAPKIVECADDQEAIAMAKQFVDGADMELWEGRRFIGRIPRGE